MEESIWSPEIEAVLDRARSKKTRHIKVAGETIEIPSPFPSPADWRDQWIYFILVDRFKNPKAPPLHAPWDGEIGTFQGGTFNGIKEELQYLQQMGVGALWLSPVLKNCQYNPFTYHGYGIQDFWQVDPRFASDPQAARKNPELAERELQDLIDEAHARGIYVIFDIVLNHAGDVFEYELDDGTVAAEADWRDTPYTVHWRDEKGHGRPDWPTPPADPPMDAAVWPGELRHNEFFRRQGRGGEAGGDFASLKELVTGLQALDTQHGFHYPVRNILILAYQHLIAKFDIDGFRIDTLKYIETEFARVFGNAIREFALSMGKKNFFTFGEVYDNEEQIARFIGRSAAEGGDLIGVDAALDFPLFYKLPGVAKALLAPTELIGLFEHRKQVERGIISSHGEASNFFVTFLDNHDQYQRVFFSPPNTPTLYADQLTLAVTVLFSLQGIPCLYYGTEQGLHGTGGTLEAVREALWGKPDAFSPNHPFYLAIQALTEIRNTQPALRYGRQYFRPISGDGLHFGVSPFPAGVLAFSRILNDQEVIVVANTDTEADWAGEVVVDVALNPAGALLEVLFTNKRFAEGERGSSSVQAPVIDKPTGSLEIREVSGAVTRGPARTFRTTLQKTEVQILGTKGPG